jgi:hypothetical protein
MSDIYQRAYELPVTLSNVLTRYVIYQGTARSIGSLSPEEFRDFVEKTAQHQTVIHEILEDISPSFEKYDRWYIILELFRVKKLKKIYESQEQAEKDIKKAA